MPLEHPECLSITVALVCIPLPATLFRRFNSKDLVLNNASKRIFAFIYMYVQKWHFMSGFRRGTGVRTRLDFPGHWF